VRFAKFSEVDGDIWTIPAERTKTGVEHRVPLSSEALQVLEIARKDNPYGYVFPSPRGKPMQVAPEANCKRYEVLYAAQGDMA
jgi:integrase